jgi:translocation and assembly module TamB
VKYSKLLAACMILAALFAAVGWLVGTNGGLRFIAARVLPHVPVTLDPATIEGRLVGPLSIGRIELAAPGVSGTIERVELDWRPAALLSRTLHLRDLRIVAPRIALEALPDEPDAGPEAEATPGLATLTLPLAVVLDRGAVLDGELRHDGRTIVSGLQLELAGRAKGHRLDVLHLEVQSAQGEIAGHARASLVSGEPWDVDLAWQLMPENGPIAGHTRIVGSVAELAVEQRFAAPLESLIEGTISGLPGLPAWQLELVVEPLPARAGPWPEPLDGMAARLRLAGRIADNSVSGHVELPGLVPGRVDVEAEGAWEDGVAIVRRLELGLADGGRLSGHGRAAPGDGLAAEFALDGTGLGWPPGEAGRVVELPRVSLRGEGAEDRWTLVIEGLARHDDLPEVEFTAALEWAESILNVERLGIVSPDGEIRATASGVLDTRNDRLDYRIAVEGDIQLPEHPPASAQFVAAGDALGVHIETLEAQLFDGTLEGAGRITWGGEDAEEAADFHLAFKDLDPSSLAPDWPGRLAGTLEIRGMPAAEDGLEVVLSSLRGELRALPLSGEGALNLAGTTLLLRPSTLAIGTASLGVSGRLGEETVRFAASLEAPALDELDDAARGSLTATAQIEGAREAPRIVLQANGARLGWHGARARTLQLDATADLSGAETSRIVAELEGFATAPGPGSALRIDADGTPADHRLRVELVQTRPDQRFQLGLEGGVADTRWVGRITELTVEEEQQQVWALRQPAALSAGADSVTLDHACMAGTLGLLCLQGAWDRAGAWSGEATLAELDLGPLSEWLGGGLLARGIVTGQVVVEAEDDRFRALSGGLELTAGDIRLLEEDSNPLIAWEGGELNLEGDETQARATLHLALADADVVEGRISVGWNAADPPLAGQLVARLEHLQLITELVPDFSDLEGRAAVQASIGGTLGAPEVLGRFEWLDGRAQIPMLGLRPEDINVVAELEAGVLTFRASGRSGDGDFQADGRFDLGADTVEGNATLRGDRLLLANLPEARVAADPDLQLRFADRQISIGGEIGIPFARISGVGGPTATTVSPDEVIVGPRARDRDEELVVTSRVRVSVGPDVRIDAAGLRGRVEGSIRTATQPQALPTGRGELRVVDGTFTAFGQRLEIETGRLIYTGGPLENPGLEIRAIRRVDEITAGALVRGTLQQPEISVYSDPPLPRAEALSYLTLGKSLDQLQAGEQSAVNQAANSLALSGGGLIARDLGRRLGFDDVSVSADDDTGGTSVVVGKYLGAGLYVSYGLGLFDTVNTLRLRYQINRRLSVEATSGIEAAADLFYTFERD